MNIIKKILSILHELGYKFKRVLLYIPNKILMARFKRCGKNIKINGIIHVVEPGKLEIGNNIHIGNNALIHAGGGVEIGDNTHIAANFTVYSQNHNYEGKVLPYDNSKIRKKVTIGENVWIGVNVNIIPGSVIGEGAIIGMGSVVAGDIPPRAIVGGNPANILKYRDEKHYDNLKRKNKFGGVNGKPIKK